jgi:hypothetical protein
VHPADLLRQLLLLFLLCLLLLFMLTRLGFPVLQCLQESPVC